MIMELWEVKFLFENVAISVFVEAADGEGDLYHKHLQELAWAQLEKSGITFDSERLEGIEQHWRSGKE